MSANNDPIEVTVDKRGNVIILIDRHNLPAADMLDMAMRAMLAAGYEKAQIVQAALAYAGKHEVSKDTPEPQKSAEKPAPVAVASLTPESTPPKDSPVESPKAVIEENKILPPPLPKLTPLSNEVVTPESKDLPVAPAPVKEPETVESKEVVAIAAEVTPVEIPPAADIAAKIAEAPVVVTPIVEVKPEPVAAVAATPPVAAVPAPPEPVAEPVAMVSPPPLPVITPPEPPVISAVPVVEVKPEPVAAATPPPFEVPPLAKAPAIPLRVQQVPVSVMGTSAATTENTSPEEKPSQSKMDEILAADRKRIQSLIAASAGNRPPSEPLTATPVNPPVNPEIPEWAVPVTSKATFTPEPVAVDKPEMPEAEPVTEMAAAEAEWQGQKFDPATSTSMLIPPMPGTSDDDTPESEKVADRPLSPPPLPRKPVSVVTPAMMSRPITAEVVDKPASSVPPPPAGGPISMLSRITGFVKLNTIAIPHYQAESSPVESTISTPKPMKPSVLSPQPPPTPPAKR